MEKIFPPTLPQPPKNYRTQVLCSIKSPLISSYIPNKSNQSPNKKQILRLPIQSTARIYKLYTPNNKWTG
ncbi:hypothetical protein BDA96_02G375700 [Sorghum bicolor]|uniref:Uncharacterized protein n=2 Tax=Sorghum bicolor TaxID=4558 RepID=A0A921UW28_SORBI|nr:hypothetical protein BDA96_02G375700 [Sorghum bicolor]OQU90178.1 hypothetical protein SORBI_3002G358450 [Sorghum bicolor]